MHYEGRSLDMTQKLVPEPTPFMGALDQAGHIGYDETVVVRSEGDAQVGDKRRERVVGDFRPCSRDLCNKGGLPRRRHAHQGGIGHELHLELNPTLGGRFAQLRERRRPARRRYEMYVSPTSNTAGHHDDLLAVMGQVGYGLTDFLGLFVVFAYDSADRDFENEVLPPRAMHAASLAMRSPLRFEMMLETVID